jgi:three-Cys-motif partner protein
VFLGSTCLRIAEYHDAMGKLVRGADGLPADEVGEWVEEKHFDVTQYVKLSHGARRQFLGPGKAGATYIDLFCGLGQARIRESSRIVDGAAIAAWRVADGQGSPFSSMYIADKDPTRRQHCATRLRALGAPVVEIAGTAAEALQSLIRMLSPKGLHFAVMDPYSLGSLRFDLLRSLAEFQRMDILVLISAMDLFRNIDQQSAGEASEFDDFAPGWRNHVPIELPQTERRMRVMEYWAASVAEELQLDTSSEMHPVKNSVNRLIYWLLLLSRHELAQKFWKIVLKGRPQSTREMFSP